MTYSPPRLTYSDDAATLYLGDCVEVMAADVLGYDGALGYAPRLIPDNSIDSIVTDPPYGLGFMGRAWDALPPGLPWARECLRVLKPGGHLIAFGGTRTWHRLAVAVEDAGFELRDSIAWLYGSGFPKSRNVTDDMGAYLAGEPVPDRQIHPDVYRVTTAIREARDAKGLGNRDIDGLFGTNGMSGHWTSRTSQPMVPSPRQWAALRELLDIPAAPDLDEIVARLGSAERPDDWGEGEGAEFLGALRNDPGAAGARGWGTALKPGFEPCVVGRKPIPTTVGENVRRWGTGAINIEGCRIGTAGGARLEPGAGGFDAGTVNALGGHLNSARSPKVEGLGRWPTNVILDDETAQELDGQSGVSTSPPVGSVARTKGGATIGAFGHEGRPPSPNGHGDTGGASRFFYVVKPDPARPAPPGRQGEASADRRYADRGGTNFAATPGVRGGDPSGRWPTNVTMDEATAADLDRQSGVSSSRSGGASGSNANPMSWTEANPDRARGGHDDMGGASRFFYVAKAGRAERPQVDGEGHPTVKPLALMRWLVRLVTPPGGTVLEPFLGSRTTVEAGIIEGFHTIGIERDPTYMDLVRARIGKPIQPDLFGGLG